MGQPCDLHTLRRTHVGLLVTAGAHPKTTAARERAEIIDREWRDVAEDWSETAEGDLVGACLQRWRGVSFETLVGEGGLEPPQV